MIEQINALQYQVAELRDYIEQINKYPFDQLKQNQLEKESINIENDLKRSPIFDLKKDGAVILTVPHTLYVAKLIKEALYKSGIKSEIILEKPDKGYKDLPHFVICPQIFESLPGFYVAFQMEQSVSTRWFTEKYFNILENSFAIFDYSLTNIKYLTSNNISAKQIFYMPLSTLSNSVFDSYEEEDVDVLFYGDINNERRKKYIEALREKYSVKVINNLFGEDLAYELSKAKVVVNIHFYENALLETTRIYECLSNNKIIVSEKSSDFNEHNALIEIVDFVEIDDIEAMLSRVEYWVSDNSRRNEKVLKNRTVLSEQYSYFNHFFYRFLLASDNITFDQFWDLGGKDYKIQSDMLCLTLPEDVTRTESFQSENRSEYQLFPGLKHSMGWIGCALSYKYMTKLAINSKYDFITIVEDDVEFIEGFDCRWKNIKRTLQSSSIRWDIFSGLLANLSIDTNIKKITKIENIEYVEIDRLISMVFNVYNRNIFHIISDWDPNNRDVHSNTIDRYLENNSSLSVVTTSPFLVGHKEDQVSTIWNFQNTQYIEMISESIKLLDEKIADYNPTLAEKYYLGKRYTQ
jgi:GR25 family glycosyltransferase involved in LPS biosynthesis